MQKEVVLACIVGPILLVYGLSILIYAKQWKKVAAWMEKDHFGMLPMAFLCLAFGLILVNAYNIWDGNVFLLITLTGWALILKSVFFFLAPASWIRAVLQLKILIHPWIYRVAGAVLAVMGAALMVTGYWAR
jgi:uncharacterized protein YjeT (DUF2065 family)